MRRLFLALAALVLTAGTATAFLVLGSTTLLTSVSVPVSGTGLAANYAAAWNTSSPAWNKLTTRSGIQYLCYYDTNTPPFPLFLTRNLATNVLAYYNPGLPASGNTNQPAPHDICAIAFDNNGYLHLTYGMHNNPLIYYRSTNPANADGTFLSAGFTAHTMTGGSNEANIAFEMFTVNPTNGELYFLYQDEHTIPTREFFYHYNTSTSTWGGATGTIADPTTANPGLLMSMPSNDSFFLHGIPLWDSSGNMWINWSRWGATVDNEYLFGWNGTSFFATDRSALTVPIDSGGTNPAPSYVVSNISPLNGFAMHNGIFYMPYLDAVGHEIWIVENSAGFAKHQLTTHSSPPPATCGSGTSQCGRQPGVVAGADGYVHVITADDWSTPPGQGVLDIKSNNNFSSFTTGTLFSTYTPNFILSPDPIRLQTGPVSFMRMDANDPDFGYTYSFSNPGSMTLYDWNLGPANPGTPPISPTFVTSYVSTGATVSGNTLVSSGSHSVSAGQTVVGLVNQFSGSGLTPTSVTDNGGNTYQLSNTLQFSTGGETLTMFAKANVSGSPTQWTANFASAPPAGTFYVLVYSGASQVDSVANLTFNGTVSATTLSLATNTVHSNTRVVGFLAYNNNTFSASGTGFTSRFNATGTAVEGQDGVQAASGAGTISWTVTPSGSSGNSYGAIAVAP